MSAIEAGKWYHSNRYNAERQCEHCSGVIRHEPWCITRNSAVAYAYTVAFDAAQLSTSDQLILHALGVSWNGKACQAKCAQ